MKPLETCGKGIGGIGLKEFIDSGGNWEEKLFP
jgi:hypothetical protein